MQCTTCTDETVGTFGTLLGQKTPKKGIKTRFLGAN